jgi:GNAT superfamily N-acetyltransferase
VLDKITIRKLWLSDHPAFRAHLKRLDPESRRLRFGNAVSEAFLDAYADTAHRLGTTIFAAFAEGEIRASAELRGLFVDSFRDAEAAFAVEAEWQDHGLGTLLMQRIITAAQNRGYGRLHMMCLKESGRMQHLAVKHGAQLTHQEGEIIGLLDGNTPTPLSLLDEAIHDAQGFVAAMLDWRAYPASGGSATPGTHT